MGSYDVVSTCAAMPTLVSFHARMYVYMYSKDICMRIYMHNMYDYVCPWSSSVVSVIQESVSSLQAIWHPFPKKLSVARAPVDTRYGILLV